MFFRKKKEKCKYEGRWASHLPLYKCPRPALPGEDCCIFHSEDIKGKKAEFDKAFWKEFKTKRKQGKGYDFMGFIFPGDVSFGGKTFEKAVSFYKAIFHGKTLFSGTTFKEAAIFEGAEFKDVNPNNETSYAGFGGAQFLKGVNFFGVVFPRDTDFSNAEFVGEAIFWLAKFPGKVNFRDTIFTGNVNFQGTHFCLLANAGEKSIDFKVDFENTQFFGRVSFFSANFYGNAKFWANKFKGITDFSHSTFHKDVEFNAAKFTGEVAGFLKTTFSGKTTFIGVKFYCDVDFVKIIIGDNAQFKMIRTYLSDVTGLFEYIEADRKKKRKNGSSRIPGIPGKLFFYIA